MVTHKTEGVEEAKRCQFSPLSQSVSSQQVSPNTASLSTQFYGSLGGNFSQLGIDYHDLF